MNSRRFMILLLHLLMILTLIPNVRADGEDPEPNPMIQRLEDAKSEIRLKKAGKYGMLPVYGRDIADGTYDIHVDSSSSFFRISKAVLTVAGDEMTVRFTIPSMSYLRVYPGTAKEAAKADKADWIEFEEEDGQTTFTFPVPSLDTQLRCAAYSKARRKWYNRTLVFEASSLPAEALSLRLPDYELIEEAIRAYQIANAEELKKQQEESAVAVQGVNMDMEDGEYSIEVNMTGGSGRASISSPTLLIIQDGQAYARLLWSSVYYDYMILNGTYFFNLSEDGGPSSFEIPVTALDEPIPVIADTTAMGEPVEIHYALTFYEETIGAKSQIPQESAKLVLVIAGAIIIGGGILDHFVKKRNK